MDAADPLIRIAPACDWPGWPGCSHSPTYDLSIHGPNGFYRHIAGTPATVLQMNARTDRATGRLRLRVTDSGDRPGHRRHGSPVLVDVADAYGNDRQIELHHTGEIMHPGI